MTANRKASEIKDMGSRCVIQGQKSVCSDHSYVHNPAVDALRQGFLAID